MSLINQMLQDLEERRSGELVTASGQPRAAPRQRHLHPAWWGAGVVIVVLIVVGAWLLGRQFAPVAAVPPLVMLTPQQAIVEPVLPMGSMNAPLSVTQEVPIATQPSGSTLQVDPPGPVEAAREAHVATSATASVDTSAVREPSVPASARPLGEPRQVSVAPESRPAPARPTPTLMQSSLPAPATQRAMTAPAPETDVNPVANQDVSKQLSQLTPQQQAENEYRRATVSIQQGKNADAIAGLERVLAIDAGHGAARQTLVGLLLGSRRQDDAQRRLQEGLLLDRAQPGLAMLLARLQIEQGNLRPAIDTLQRSLPHAADRADYLAFLAALFQRDGRHKETIESYIVALRQSPQNGTWWMGLGISLQAEGRLAEARDAFFRAKETNTLAPELTAFVDQKLTQLR